MSTQLHYFAMSTPARCRFLPQRKWISCPRRQKTCLQRQAVSMPFRMRSRPLKINSNSSMETEPSQQQQPPPSMSTNAAGETRQQQPPPSLSMSTEAAPTVEEVISSLRDINDPAKLDVLILTINNVILYKSTQNKASTSSHLENEAWWTSVITSVEAWWTPVITSVEAFLKFVDELLKNKEHVLNFGESTKVFTEILQCIGKVCWIVGRLSGVAYLVQKVKKVSENQSECLRLLQRIKMLASSVKDSSDVIPKEDDKLKNAVALMVKGTIMCILQMNSHKLFRFLKTSVNAKKLNDLLVKIEQVHDELTLATTTNSAKQQPRTLPVSKPEYPKEAVGIDVPKEEVKHRLKMTPEHEQPLAEVIYAIGGSGKTTLATAVIAELDLNEYQYARVYLDQDQNKNDLKEMQKQILKDAFPNYQSREINLRDCDDGRKHLQKAFQCPENKPIFLFIDNALRSTDLAELLPLYLKCLPKRSRILLTARKLDVTDILSERGLQRVSYPVPPLQEENAVEILLKDIDKRRHMDLDLTRILNICGGVPLVLKIVGAHLKKMDYDVENCSQILDALEKGKDIIEEDLSERVVHSVYREFEEDTKDAFLDICCFFNGWYRRHVEYVVGAEQVKSLEEAAFLTLTLVVVGNDENDGVYAGEQKITVHDIVRAKGRNMSGSTRIMDLESWREAAQDEAMLKEIKGVWFGDESPDFELEERHLSLTAKKLRILALGDSMGISGQSGRNFGQLRYLRVGGCQLPMKFEALHSLGVYEGPTEGVSLYKELPKKLSMIKATDVMSEDSSVEEAIPNSVLKELHLAGLEKLPGGLQNLSALKILFLNYWCFKELGEEVCRLSSLKKLNMWECVWLKRLPESFGSLTSLTHLDLSYCWSLEELPRSFGLLGNLQILFLNECYFKELGEEVCRLSSLEKLSLRRCSRLKRLPESFGSLTSLTHLDLEGCTSLEELPPSFGLLANLQHLVLGGCFKLKELPGGGEQLTALNYIDVRGCDQLNLDGIKRRENVQIDWW